MLHFLGVGWKLHFQRPQENFYHIGLMKSDGEIGKLRHRRSTHIRTFAQTKVVLRPGLRCPRAHQNLQLNYFGTGSYRIVPLLFLDPKR